MSNSMLFNSSIETQMTKRHGNGRSLHMIYIPNGIGASHVGLAHNSNDHNSQDGDAGYSNNVPNAKAVSLARPARR